jgi:hypothetical protein
MYPPCTCSVASVWRGGKAMVHGSGELVCVIRRDPMKHTCGDTSMLASGDDTFWLAYSDFLRPNARGEPAKAILLQQITVRLERPSCCG